MIDPQVLLALSRVGQLDPEHLAELIQALAARYREQTNQQMTVYTDDHPMTLDDFRHGLRINMGSFGDLSEFIQWLLRMYAEHTGKGLVLLTDAEWSLVQELWDSTWKHHMNELPALAEQARVQYERAVSPTANADDHEQFGITIGSWLQGRSIQQDRLQEFFSRWNQCMQERQHPELAENRQFIGALNNFFEGGRMDLPGNGE